MKQPADHAIEVVRDDYPTGPFRAAILDFDGTLSLIRRNWQDVMVPMMVDLLADTPAAESRGQLEKCVADFVARLTGRQTIYQMIRLAEEIGRRGGRPLEPIEYKHRYHDLLWGKVRGRIDALRSGSAEPDEMTVPGSRELLTRLQRAGLELYLASGTDLKYVEDEAALLQLDQFFGGRIYGARDDYQNFSKAMIVEQILDATGIDGRQLVGFGDGFVEIEKVKAAGGLAVGVASNEETRRGVDAWKRERLIEAGADFVVPDYRELDRLLDMLGVP